MWFLKLIFWVVFVVPAIVVLTVLLLPWYLIRALFYLACLFLSGVGAVLSALWALLFA